MAWSASSIPPPSPPPTAAAEEEVADPLSDPTGEIPVLLNTVRSLAAATGKKFNALLVGCVVIGGRCAACWVVVASGRGAAVGLCNETGGAGAGRRGKLG